MTLNKLLIANRAEIAIRIARTAAAMGIATVAVYPPDDENSLHTRRCDEARKLPGRGVSAYLDAAQLVAAAVETGCDAVHPGYGFLAENAEFAAACESAGLVFVGPTPESLRLFGQKGAARAFAGRHGVPVTLGTSGATDLASAHAFMERLGPGAAVMVKAISGGGGRGMRPVMDPLALPAAFERCREEALAAFGDGALYVEQLLPRARHIEVQILGDGTGAVTHLWERECSIQRQRQKLIEFAPAPGLSPTTRIRLTDAATGLAAAATYRNAGTFEFLVDASEPGNDPEIAFIEANARLQVEHTVTEEITGVDLVEAQLRIAGGQTLADIGLTQADIPVPERMSMQVRVNLETMTAQGNAKPAGGVLSAYDIPSGPGVRVDGYGYTGYRTSPAFDSLLAKVIVTSRSTAVADVAKRASRALAEFRISGAATNITFLRAILEHPDFLSGQVHTRFVDEAMNTLLPRANDPQPQLHFEPNALAGANRTAGIRLASTDPLAVVALGKERDEPSSQSTKSQTENLGHTSTLDGAYGTEPLLAPMQGTIISIDVNEGEAVHRGQPLLVMEAMKMQHEVAAPVGGIVRAIAVAVGDTVFEEHPLLFIEESEDASGVARVDEDIDLDLIRPDLAEILARRARIFDEARPAAVERRRRTGQRTARENLNDLCDPDSFVEYGSLALAARRTTTPIETLVDKTPADGFVMGLAHINGEHFPEDRSRVVVGAYDYTVMAGTQGKRGHAKQDRMYELAERWRLPTIIYTEGGGGRGSDPDYISILGGTSDTFHQFPRLSGLVPLVGITSGRCFAGNAVLLACCDVIIATQNSNIGMAGPAMIEGGGLGVYRPEDIGPMSVQVPNGVVDIVVADEREGAKVARQYLSYFQGRVEQWDCDDQRRLRHAVPENRMRGYDMRSLIGTLADTDSMLEIRQGFGQGMITAFIRLEGRPIGVIANNPMHLGGAIDADAADKAARFMQLCDAHDVPLLYLCDTPGNMVGPEAEKTALVRHCGRAYVVGANVTVPTFMVVTRKAYGLGAQAMGGGNLQIGAFCVSWPTGEFGGMGLEGKVKLGHQRELAAISDPAERIAKYEQMVAAEYEQGKALNVGSLYEVDDVIDPADTRKWILTGLRAMPPTPARTGKKRQWVDAW
jgi:acetyl/propionyl-CoA carboxylase alpha subunit/acetyl-CoA carboxylase carboxyltransferase component